MQNPNDISSTFLNSLVQSIVQAAVFFGDIVAQFFNVGSNHFLGSVGGTSVDDHMFYIVMGLCTNGLHACCNTGFVIKDNGDDGDFQDFFYKRFYKRELTGPKAFKEGCFLGLKFYGFFECV
jgi:hypothetical protein